MTDPIATLVRNERQRRAQTQAEAAAEMRVCQTSVSSWERGETVPAFRLRGRVARWLRMTVHGVTDACLVGLAGMSGEDESENNNQREEGEMGEETDGERIIARMALTPQDRVYLAHSETVTVDITDHPEIVRLRAENERLKAWRDAVQSAAYEVTKMHDNGPECWPAWFEGYGLDGLCEVMWDDGERTR